MATDPETELRVLRRDEWDRWYDQLVRASGARPVVPEERKLDRSLTEFGRCLGVWDRDACVGTAGSFGFRTTVPGGALVPAAGVALPDGGF
jgi:hypothetical protein